MGYRVEYDSVKKVRGVQKRTAGRLAMTGVFFLVFLVLVACFWPEGASILRDALLPGDSAVTAAALEELARQVSQGTDLSQAVTEFCRDLLAGAGIGVG